MKIGRSFRRAKASQGTESVFRGMLTLAMGSGAARLVSIAAIPILSRIYAPEDYGVLSVFTALTLLLAPLLTLRYLTALPLPRHEGLALSLLALCGILVAGGAALVSVLLWTFGPYLLRLMSMEALIPYRWLIVVCLVGAAAYETMVMWATRARAYRDIAKTQFTQSALKALCQIGLGLLAIKPLGLLIGHTVGVSAGLGSLLWRSRERFRDNVRFITWRNIGRVARGYRSFPLYRLPSQLLLVYSVQAPLLLSAYFFAPAEVGNLGMAITLVTLPASLISQNITKAQFAEASKIRQDAIALYKMNREVLKKTAMIASIPSAIVFFGSYFLLPIILGGKWALAGTLSSLLGIALFSQMISQPTVNVLTVVGRNDMFLKFNILRFVLVTSALCIPPMLGAGIILTVLVYSISLSIQRISQMMVVLNILKSNATRAGGT